MSKTTIKFAILAIVLILLQVIGLNNMCLFGVAMAFAYIYVLLHLPLDLSQNWVLTIGFFSDSLSMYFLTLRAWRRFHALFLQHCANRF